MKNNRFGFFRVFVPVLAVCVECLAAVSAEQILSATGVKGGLVVHLECGGGELTAGLHACPALLVHGLDKDASDVARARDYLLEAGLYGPVSVEQWHGTVLPYNSNAVNLVVAEELGDVRLVEVIRVLCPGGVAYLKQGQQWKKVVKTWPADIDQWTHFLHDADNNAVANDKRIATPNHLQWQAEPKRTRDHDALASISAMTSSNGRIFYILDEGPTSLIHRPAKWKLIARDAFNGKLLWKRVINPWMTHLRYFRSGPVQLPRRLVSIGERVYVTLGFDAPVAMLDAATGRTITTYKGSEKAEEFICSNGVLLVVLGEPQVWNKHATVVDNYWEFYDEQGPEPPKRIVAYDVDTGEMLWHRDRKNLARLVPLSLTAGGDRVFYLDRSRLHCLELRSGKPLWQVPFETRGLFLRNYAPTVVHYKDTIACLSLERLAVYSVDDGRKLWQTKGYAGFASPGDLFIIDDTVWTFPVTQGVRVKPADVPGAGKEFLAFDLYTGRVKKSLVKDDVWPGGHHHRCYRNKATQRYLISSRRGLEFVDLVGRDNTINWWVRSICQYGFMPCNGLIYAAPHPCQCFVDIKFDGFHALAAEAVEMRPSRGDRLLKGPAYGKVAPGPASAESPVVARSSADMIWSPPVPNDDPQDWPTYRHDISRSGCATTDVPAQLQRRWKTQIAERLSSVVVAAKKVLVSAVDQQTVYCLDAGTGRKLWRFVAGGRVDSPPTVWGQTAIFGCRDGCVYSVRLGDGELVWRFRAAPIDRRTVVRDRVESLWPVHGSVLAAGATVYFAAGYTSYLDGGLTLWGLDAATGAVKYKAALSTDGASRDGAMPDVLVCDGRTIGMRFRRFDLSLGEVKASRPAMLTTGAGLLDDCWGHRDRWNWTLGAGDTFGELLVFDGEMAFGVQSYYTFLKHDRSMQPATHTGHLHQKYARYTPEQFPTGTRLFARANGGAGKGDAQNKRRRTLAANDHRWNLKTPIQYRAMVLSGDALFGAGWVDSVALSGGQRQTGTESVLTVTAATDGRRLAEYKLEAEPVFDGMAAAYGSLYLALKDGSVICLAGR